MKTFCTLAFIDKFLQTIDYVSVNKCFNALSFFGKKVQPNTGIIEIQKYNIDKKYILYI